MYTHYFFIAHRQLTMCFVFTKLQQHSKDENNTPVNCVHSSSKLGVLATKMELDIYVLQLVSNPHLNARLITEIFLFHIDH